MSELIRIEVFSFGNFEAIWRFEVVASHNVIDVVDSSGSKSDFGEISGPNTSISIFSLILGEVRCVDVIVNISILNFKFTYLSRPIPDSSAVYNGGERGGL